jgi:hypothetical protein
MAVNVDPNQRGSFLAFLYHIRFTPEVREAFHDKQRSNEVMLDFGLTAAERELVWILDPPGSPPAYPPITDPAIRAQKWAELVAQLLPEFYAWTYPNPPVDPPPWW